MNSKTRWWTRLGAVATATMLGIFVPVAAWAHERPNALAAADEMARRRPGVRAGGLLAAVCCLAVVALVVLVVALATRGRRSRRP